MTAPYIVDLVEAAPGEWAHTADAAKVAAARPALADADKRDRPRTPADIPVLGSGAEGFAILVCLALIVIARRALMG